MIITENNGIRMRERKGGFPSLPSKNTGPKAAGVRRKKNPLSGNRRKDFPTHVERKHKLRDRKE